MKGSRAYLVVIVATVIASLAVVPQARTERRARAALPDAASTCAHSSIGTPEPARTWYTAEGATAGGFETRVLVANPGRETARAPSPTIPARGVCRDRSWRWPLKAAGV